MANELICDLCFASIYGPRHVNRCKMGHLHWLVFIKFCGFSKIWESFFFCLGHLDHKYKLICDLLIVWQSFKNISLQKSLDEMHAARCMWLNWNSKLILWFVLQYQTCVWPYWQWFMGKVIIYLVNDIMNFNVGLGKHPDCSGRQPKHKKGQPNFKEST